MFKPILISAALGGMMCVATSAFAATPAVPSPTAIQNTAIEHQNPAVEQAQWGWRGGWHRNPWNRRAMWRHRAWRNGGWRYW